MSYTTVFCIADSHAQADCIIDLLKEAKFTSIRKQVNTPSRPNGGR